MQRIAPPVLLFGRAKRDFLLLAKPIDNAIAGYAKQPTAHSLDRFRQLVRLDKFKKYILQDIFSVRIIANSRLDESRQFSAFSRDSPGDVVVSVYQNKLMQRLHTQ